MSRPTVGWLRVSAFPDRVRRTESPDVTAVLPDPPKNGQYPAWVYVVCSFLVAIDYLVVSAGVLVLAFALSVNGVPPPEGRIGSLATVLGLAATVVLSVAEALEYAHGKDISHTDLKPENILYSEDYFGRLVLVTDWGKRPVVNPDLESMLSRPYAAPEQFDALPTNEPEAELIDIYQLGMLAYELFAGTQPFLTGEDTEQQVRTEVPPPPGDHTPGLPEGLDEVILTAIEKNPSDRYQTVAEFRTELVDVMLPDVMPGE